MTIPVIVAIDVTDAHGTKFPGYLVTEDGKIWSTRVQGRVEQFREPRELKTTHGSNSYRRVCLYLNGKRAHRTVHSLVLGSFIGPCPEGLEARHLDGDSMNNHRTNLEWATRQVNLADRKIHSDAKRRAAA